MKMSILAFVKFPCVTRESTHPELSMQFIRCSTLYEAYAVVNIYTFNIRFFSDRYVDTFIHWAVTHL